MKSFGTLLVVDDDSVLREVVCSMLTMVGFTAIEASGGAQAKDIIADPSQPLDAVILDRYMPDVNGLEVMAWLQQQRAFTHLPVIMLTGANKPQEIAEGLEAGVFYYLTKPVEHRMLRLVVEAAVHQHHTYQSMLKDSAKTHGGVALLTKARCVFSTLAEAKMAARLLAYAFPDPQRSMPGLLELCTNAVEHGNFEIGYHKKSQLLSSHQWDTEMAIRAENPRYNQRKVVAVMERNTAHTRVQITDEGKGFDWQNYLTIHVTRALDAHGRGIALANQLAFDALHYNPKGNQVTATVAHALDTPTAPMTTGEPIS